MNGLFTVVGGLLSVVISLLLGFNFAVMVALALYALALGVFKPMREMVPRTATAAMPARSPEVPEGIDLASALDQATPQPGIGTPVKARR